MSVPATATPENETDEIVGLVLRARAGDREAFGDLVERLWTELTALARAVLAADDEAEDLVQDALVHAWQRLWTLRRPESFAAVAPSPSDRIDAARLLAALAPRQRAALYLTWIEGCTNQEAGRVLGLRPATAKPVAFERLALDEGPGGMDPCKPPRPAAGQGTRADQPFHFQAPPLPPEMTSP